MVSWLGWPNMDTHALSGGQHITSVNKLPSWPTLHNILWQRHNVCTIGICRWSRCFHILLVFLGWLRLVSSVFQGKLKSTHACTCMNRQIFCEDCGAITGKNRMETHNMGPQWLETEMSMWSNRRCCGKKIVWKENHPCFAQCSQSKHDAAWWCMVNMLSYKMLCLPSQPTRSKWECRPWVYLQTHANTHKLRHNGIQRHRCCSKLSSRKWHLRVPSFLGCARRVYLKLFEIIWNYLKWSEIISIQMQQHATTPQT